jgi:hypothetical protein
MARPALIRQDQAHWTGAVYDSEFWGLDQRAYWALSEQGGSYSFVDPLVLGGDSIELQTELAINNGGQITVDSGAIILAASGSDINGAVGSAFTWSGAATFNGAVAFNGALTMGATGSLAIEDGGTLGLENRVGATCTPFTRTRIMGCGGVASEVNNFTKINTTVASYWLQASISAPRIYIPLTFVPLAASITTLTVQLKGASSHVGLPVTMPSVQLIRQDADAYTLTATNTATDPSADVPTYESVHPVTLSGLNVQPINYAWSVLINGEASTNALVGLEVYSLSVTWSSNSIGL